MGCSGKTFLANDIVVAAVGSKSPFVIRLQQDHRNYEFVGIMKGNFFPYNDATNDLATRSMSRLIGAALKHGLCEIYHIR